MTIIGVDYHPSFQAIVFLAEETAEYAEQEQNLSEFGATAIPNPSSLPRKRNTRS